MQKQGSGDINTRTFAFRRWLGWEFLYYLNFVVDVIHAMQGRGGGGGGKRCSHDGLLLLLIDVWMLLGFLLLVGLLLLVTNSPAFTPATTEIIVGQLQSNRHICHLKTK
jgi:hypothetical protein